MKRHARIQYVGLPGVTSACFDAVARLIQFGDQIRCAKVLSGTSGHALLLTVNADEMVAVKTGFSSGYAGEGPSGLSRVLALLDRCGANIEEYDVRQSVLSRIDQSSLTDEDLSALERAEPVRPSRWRGYILRADWKEPYEILVQHLPLVMPYALIDVRIMDLALQFFEDPDGSLLTGYRRLESIVKERTGTDKYGQDLFSQAFLGTNSRLTWDGVDGNEAEGRGRLFRGAYGAYRNPRAHREQVGAPEDLLAEFLLLNHLYMLERNAKPRQQEARDPSTVT